MNNNVKLDAPYGTNEELAQKFASLKDELLSLPVRQSGRINVFGWDLEYVSGPALFANLEYQILKRVNDFYPDNDQPLILDAGANIGLSVLHYKRQFPGARIIAFEPDPTFLPVLRRNLERNGAEDVEVVDAAAWITSGEATWYCEGIDGSKLVTKPPGEAQVVNVQTVDLAQYLDQDVDLVKMDIEGAELHVVPHLAGKLGLVKNLSIECHLELDSFGACCNLLATLDNEGFQLGVNSFNIWRDLVRFREIQPDHFAQYFVVSAWRSPHPKSQPQWGIIPSLEIHHVLDKVQLEYQLQQTIQQCAEVSSKCKQLEQQHQELTSKYAEILGALQELQLPLHRRAVRKIKRWMG